MDEVVPKLWIGDLSASLTPSYLDAANVHWIISCMRNPPAFPSEIPTADDHTRSIPKENMLVIPIDDQDDTPIYIYFDKCNRFIAEALREEWIPNNDPAETIAPEDSIEGLTLRNGQPGLWRSQAPGSVLVHCQAGCSRSVTIVAAYLMWSRDLRVEQALHVIRRQRPIAEPNDGFKKQLQMYQTKHRRVVLHDREVRNYLLNHTSVMDGHLTPESLLIKPEDQAKNQQAAQCNEDSQAKKARLILRCKMCRRELANDEHVVQHQPGKGKLAFEPHRRDNVRRGGDWTPAAVQAANPSQPVLPTNLARIQAGISARIKQPSLLHSPQCSAYFVEPLKWMSESSNLVEGELSDRIMCPNTRCNAKLGNWTWAGSQCAWYVSL
ncbi:hypothetical protein MYAM1_000202 [Malassezia yamatoensis]|uniref:protein-tyrosine-phosphatase n=1 Tax=Malassezia yamatoensis TaxID=253288 RepID=A0AAJ5YND4_9BASI|nr:hypothetical protein MYAM1_000202 [Malassezia yamatoensis]